MKFSDKHIEPKKQAIVLILSLFISIFTGFIPDWTGVPFSTPDQMLFSSGIFIILLLVDVLWVLAVSTSLQIQEFEHWKIREKADIELATIRACFFQIAKESYSRRELFVTHFLREITDLRRRIKDVAERGELRVIGHHFLSADNVLEAFQGDADPTWRFIWPIEEGDKLFHNQPWRRYFEETTKLLQEKVIKDIRVIFIIEDKEIFKYPRFAKLLDFFQTNDRRDCRIVSRADYDFLCKDTGIPSICVDFGIYSDKLLFLTEKYEPEIEGVFTKDSDKILHYQTLFDTIWKSRSISSGNPSTAIKKISLDELIRFDEEQPAIPVGENE